MAPLSPERYKLQVTIDAETYHALRQLQDLLRHQVPNGDLAVIIKGAVLPRLAQVQRERFAHVKRPRKMNGQTTFVPEDGHHDVVPNPEYRVSASPEMSRDLNPVPQADAGVDSSSGTDSDVSSTRSADLHVRSRHIPAEVKRAVWQRDQGRCAFIGRSGRRCSERKRLEYHHVTAYALGGPATIENIALRCRAHNAHEGVRLFGGNGTRRKPDKSNLVTGAGASSRSRNGAGAAASAGSGVNTGAGANG